jgi:hypothetical protein
MNMDAPNGLGVGPEDSATADVPTVASWLTFSHRGTQCASLAPYYDFNFLVALQFIFMEQSHPALADVANERWVRKLFNVKSDATKEGKSMIRSTVVVEIRLGLLQKSVHEALRVRGRMRRHDTAPRIVLD